MEKIDRVGGRSPNVEQVEYRFKAIEWKIERYNNIRNDIGW